MPRFRQTKVDSPSEFELPGGENSGDECGHRRD